MTVHHANIPDAVRTAQARASDPAASVFVAANAGSGKTHVLVNRVIRLLLNGVPPEKILCITFTKAAAANMAQRVFETLGHWVTLSDHELDDAIRAAGAPQPSAPLRKRARELFACALETPGGLKVQTIHALCTRLLQQFPFEANVPARFTVLDERDQNEMMERANLDVLLQAARDGGSQLGRALNVAMATAADVTFKDVVRAACFSRDHFMAWADNAGSIDNAISELSRTLCIDQNETSESLVQEIQRHAFSAHECEILIRHLIETENKVDNAQANRLRRALTAGWPDAVDDYADFFLKEDGGLKDDKYLLSKSIRENFPDLISKTSHERDRIAPLVTRLRATRLRDRTQALLVIASAVAANYRREKQTRGLLDYDDLIDKTLAMLDNIASGWVHFKLDRGIDHILIDEAQDTSPRQWDIIARLAAEFTSGMGARDGIKRTIFAVGDEKQSIFSFQGAAPHEFDTRRSEMKRKFEAAGLAFDPVSFTYSFRSGANVLQAVSSTFQAPRIYRSVTSDLDGGMPPHMALEDAAPGLIDLWELEEPDEKKKIEGWDAPYDTMSETSPEVRLARRVQSEIKTLIDEGALTGKGAPLRYGDIMVLVRRRGKAFDAVIQALKHANIPVAGADRLKLTEHIAIIDLMNLTDALLLPRDDLALAVALKSPLFGLDDNDLLTLAPHRKGSLRQALTDHASHPDKFDSKLRAALERLEECEARFAKDTPFAFYAWLLGGHGGRAHILKRLGLEANDALDEFLELALSYEQKAPASLQGFMAWLRAADTDIKRDMEIRRDEVRVMTVHGAKGLEASVVFLVDTATSPTDTPRLNLIRIPQGNAAPHAPDVVVWAGRKTDDPPAVATARTATIQESEDEYRRLLYVAMTRAADRLIVGGCLPGNRKEVQPDSWYGLIAQGLANSSLPMTELQRSHGPVKRYARMEDTAALVSAIETNTVSASETLVETLPAWLHTRVAAKAPASILLHPSEMVENDDIVTGKSAETRTRALQRGTLVHRLLQSLPEIALDRRSDAAKNFLVRHTRNPNTPDDKKWTAPECDALAAQVLALIGEEKFAPLFASGSRAEVSIAGRIDRPGRPPISVSGQIDRLVVTDDQIAIIDYKTNQTPPDSAANAPPSYVRQLALYRAILTKLYPGRPVRCALLWTETIEMMEISASVLDAELTRIISINQP